MRTLFFFILIFSALLTLSVNAQKREFVEIAPETGKIIDRDERDYFCLWQSFDNYHGARICKLNSDYELEIFIIEEDEHISKKFKFTSDDFKELKEWIHNFKKIRNPDHIINQQPPDTPKYLSPQKQKIVKKIELRSLEIRPTKVQIKSIYNEIYPGILIGILDKYYIVLMNNAKYDTLRISSISDFKIVNETNATEFFLNGGLAGAAVGTGAMFIIGSGLGLIYIPIIGAVIGGSCGLILSIFQGTEYTVNFRKYSESERLKFLLKILEKK